MAVDLVTSKVQPVIRPAAIVDDASFTTVEIDTKGFDYVRVIVQIGATDVDMVALKMQESDTTGTGFTDVTGLVYGTSENIAGSTSALPTATDDDKVYEFHINMLGRKRFLDLVATAGNGTTGTYASAIALLGRGEDTPTTTAEYGAAEVLRV